MNIQNTDNTVSKTYHPDADGSIRMEITEDDALFSGDFTVFAYACDQVGMKRKYPKERRNSDWRLT